MGLFDGPMFDFNGDGKMDMLEFLAVAQNDPTNPINENDSEEDYDYNYDNNDSTEDDSDY